MTAHRITAAERRALLALDPAVPRHPVDLWRRDRVRPATLDRLAYPLGDRPALARLLELKPSTVLRVEYTPFFILTDAGAAAIGKAARR